MAFAVHVNFPAMISRSHFNNHNHKLNLRLTSSIKNKKHSHSAAISENAPPFDLQTYLEDRANLVHRTLDAFVPLQPPEPIHHPMRYALLAGGKRVRPILSLAACELVGGPPSSALPAACAAEMIHTMSLIHDDLPYMDDDALRRGRPSTHVAFGQPTAVLAGDALLLLAFELLASSSSAPPDLLLRAVLELARAVGREGLAAGQIVDVSWAGTPESGDVERLEYVHEHKTAALLEGAMVMGAVLGGATEEEVERVRRYGACLGLLFQVVDDMLDVTRSTEELGKTAGKDAAVGKLTYPAVVGMERTTEIVEELLAEAMEQLDAFDPERARPLLALTHYVVHRSN